MSPEGTSRDLAREILALPGPRRVDRLRRALRGGEFDVAAVSTHLPSWLDLYRRDAQPALRVLVLEALEGQADPRVHELLHAALEDRGDSVRLEALRQLVRREGDGARAIALTLLEDEAMEVCVFAAQCVYGSHRERALDALVTAVRREARGPREMHTLRWVMEFLAEEAVDVDAAARVAALRGDCDDVEGMIDWALAKLTSSKGENA